MKRIHIVGAGPRTGTTLLAEAMRACFAIDAVERHEAPLSRHRRRAGVYLTEMPGDIPIVEPRLRIDRHFYGIAIVRDPRDAVVSRHARLPHLYYTRFAYGRLTSPGHPSSPRPQALRPDPLRGSRPRPRRRPGFQIAERLPFLRKTGSFSRFHEVAEPSKKSLTALGGLRPIDDSSIGTWREHLPRLVGQLAQHGPITGELIEFGYESDDRWLVCSTASSPTWRQATIPSTSGGRSGNSAGALSARRRLSPPPVFSACRWRSARRPRAAPHAIFRGACGSDSGSVHCVRRRRRSSISQRPAFRGGRPRS